LRDLDFTPEGEWKWTFYGFIIGSVIGSGLHSIPILGSVTGGALGGTVGWLLNFYDKNFS
jgi:hypothetical protein